jgi:hypothetical protein
VFDGCVADEGCALGVAVDKAVGVLDGRVLEGFELGLGLGLLYDGADVGVADGGAALGE